MVLAGKNRSVPRLADFPFDISPACLIGAQSAARASYTACGTNTAITVRQAAENSILQAFGVEYRVVILALHSC